MQPQKSLVGKGKGALGRGGEEEFEEKESNKKGIEERKKLKTKFLMSQNPTKLQKTIVIKRSSSRIKKSTTQSKIKITRNKIKEKNSNMTNAKYKNNNLTRKMFRMILILKVLKSNL